MTASERAALDAHDEQLAQEFEAMAEKLRLKEADYRSSGWARLAEVHANSAHTYMLAAKHCRQHARDRALEPAHQAEYAAAVTRLVSGR